MPFKKLICIKPGNTNSTNHIPVYTLQHVSEGYVARHGSHALLKGVDFLAKIAILATLAEPEK